MIRLYILYTLIVFIFAGTKVHGFAVFNTVTGTKVRGFVMFSYDSLIKSSCSQVFKFAHFR